MTEVFVKSAQQVLLPEDQFGGPRFLGEYGYEFFSECPLEHWVLSKLEILNKKGRDEEKPLALDLGGASGYRAMSMARAGYNVIVIDKKGSPEYIKERNRILSEENPGNGKITLEICDIRDLDHKRLMAICNEQKPSVVTAYNLIHFIHSKENLEKIFDVLAISMEPGGILGISFVSREICESSLSFHNEHIVETMVNERGFNSAFILQGVIIQRQGFILRK